MWMAQIIYRCIRCSFMKVSGVSFFLFFFLYIIEGRAFRENCSWDIWQDTGWERQWSNGCVQILYTSQIQRFRFHWLFLRHCFWSVRSWRLSVTDWHVRDRSLWNSRKKQDILQVKNKTVWLTEHRKILQETGGSFFHENEISWKNNFQRRDFCNKKATFKVVSFLKKLWLPLVIF